MFRSWTVLVLRLLPPLSRAQAKHPDVLLSLSQKIMRLLLRSRQVLPNTPFDQDTIPCIVILMRIINPIPVVRLSSQLVPAEMVSSKPVNNVMTVLTMDLAVVPIHVNSDDQVLSVETVSSKWVNNATMDQIMVSEIDVPIFVREFLYRQDQTI